MTKRSGGGFNSRHASVGKSFEPRAIAEIRPQFGVAHPAKFIEACILSHHAMPFAEHEIIAVGRSWVVCIKSQIRAIEHRQDLDD